MNASGDRLGQTEDERDIVQTLLQIIVYIPTPCLNTVTLVVVAQCRCWGLVTGW